MEEPGGALLTRVDVRLLAAGVLQALGRSTTAWQRPPRAHVLPGARPPFPQQRRHDDGGGRGCGRRRLGRGKGRRSEEAGAEEEAGGEEEP
jgi:hypothetical protein